MGGVDGPRFFGIEDRDIGGAADGEGSFALEAHDAGGGDGHFFDDLRPGEVAGLDEGFGVERERGFEADDAEGGFVEFEFFFFAGVGGVVGGEAVDGAVDDALDAGVDVGPGAEGGIHFGIGVVAAVEGAAGFVGEKEVVRSNLGGDGLAVALGLADEFDGAGGGDVLDVVACADAFIEEEIACDHEFLGDGGETGEAEFDGGGAGVHGPAGKRWFFAVLGEDAAEHFDVLEGFEHDGGGSDADAIIGEADGTGGVHEGHLGEFLPLAALGDGADGKNIAKCGGLGAGMDEADLGVIIESGRSVGHAADGGEATRGGGGAASGDGFLGFLAGLAEVNVDVDEARCDREAGAVNDGEVRGFGAERIGFTDRGDFAVGDKQVGGALHFLRRIEKGTVG